MSFCSQCGARNEDGSKFCASCGAPLVVSEPAPVPAPVPVEAYQAPVYDTPQYQSQSTMTVEAAPVEKKSTKGKVFGIISFVLGIFSLVMSWAVIWNIFTLAGSIVGMIFGGISKKNRPDFGLGKTGKVLSVIALILSIISIIIWTIVIIVLIVEEGDLDRIF